MTMENSGYDLLFEHSSLNDGCSIDIITNIAVVVTPTSSSKTVLRLSRTSTRYFIGVYDESDILYESFEIPLRLIPKSIRVFAHNNFLSVYVNGNWVHTFWFAQIVYQDLADQTISIKSNGQSITFQNITLVELFDWREAIYADLDSVAANALSSVIQSRPIDINPNSEGYVNFIYSEDKNRDVLSINQKLITYLTIDDDPASVMSDAVVYGSVVQILTSKVAAALYGFITKMIRVPELDNGAKRAAQVILKQTVQKARTYTIIMRSDLRIEYGDILTFDYVLSGTKQKFSAACIVEAIVIEFSDAKFIMTITGRDYVNS